MAPSFAHALAATKTEALTGYRTRTIHQVYHTVHHHAKGIDRWCPTISARQKSGFVFFFPKIRRPLHVDRTRLLFLGPASQHTPRRRAISTEALSHYYYCCGGKNRTLQDDTQAKKDYENVQQQHTPPSHKIYTGTNI